jgi:threonine aldolase
MDFASDNASGADPKILAALVAANAKPFPAYGEDPYSKRAADMLSGLFERDCAVFLVATGTAANALALAALSPPWGAVFCHEDAHIMDDECGAPEFFTAGAKLVGIPGRLGKIAPEDFQRTLDAYPRGLTKQVQPAALSLSQATESGALYTPAEVAELARRAHAVGVRVHMDGARFANAVAALGCTPAELTWKAGVDALSFGATKNGTLACEAVVFFDKTLAQDFAYRRKRGGHLLSKGRLLGVQMIAYLEEDFWLDRARRANACAARLADGLARVAGVRIPWPPQANEIFVILPRAIDKALKAAGARYYDWGTRGLSDAEKPGADEVFVRLVASYATRDFEIERFVAVCRETAADAP